MANDGESVNRVGHISPNKLHRCLYPQNSVRKSRRSAKNLKRRLRRKRSVTRYYSYLKQLRHKRQTHEQYYSSLSMFGVAHKGMECMPSNYFIMLDDPLTEVANWHKQEQIAYWRSRAVSLEYENRMLYAHLKSTYLHQIKEFSGNYPLTTQLSDTTSSYTADKRETVDSPKKYEDCSSKIINQKHEGLKRKEDMTKLYGNAASKIIGMETAMQLNYDHNIAQLKPTFWPNMPLKLNYK